MLTKTTKKGIVNEKLSKRTNTKCITFQGGEINQEKISVWERERDESRKLLKRQSWFESMREVRNK